MVVVSVELLEFLLTMQRNVRGIYVQNQLLEHRGEAGNEVLDQHLVQRPGIGAGGARLQATERGRTGQGPIPPNRCLHQQVGAQRIVIVQVFIAAAQAVQALGQKIAQAMMDAPRRPALRQRTGRHARQTRACINTSQQHQPAIRTEVATGEIRLQMAPPKAAEIQLFSGTYMDAPVLPSSQIRNGQKVEIAPVHPDFVRSQLLALSLMGFAGRLLYRFVALSVLVPLTGFANHGLTSLAITV